MNFQSALKHFFNDAEGLNQDTEFREAQRYTDQIGLIFDRARPPESVPAEDPALGILPARAQVRSAPRAHRTRGIARVADDGRRPVADVQRRDGLAYAKNLRDTFMPWNQKFGIDRRTAQAKGGKFPVCRAHADLVDAQQDFCLAFDLRFRQLPDSEFPGGEVERELAHELQLLGGYD